MRCWSHYQLWGGTESGEGVLCEVWNRRPGSVTQPLPWKWQLLTPAVATLYLVSALFTGLHHMEYVDHIVKTALGFKE